jgi:hypothetical protein
VVLLVAPVLPLAGVAASWSRAFDPATKGLSVRAGRHLAVDGIDVALDTGVHGVLGPNGAGKTTLMKGAPPSCADAPASSASPGWMRSAATCGRSVATWATCRRASASTRAIPRASSSSTSRG